MSVPVSINQPAQIHQRFIDQTVTYHAASSGSDPELKKVLPMLFASIAADGAPASHTEDDEDVFADLYVDKTTGIVHKSVGAQKTTPIAAEDMIGISTYFSSFHPGIDYRAKVGTTIHAMLPGVVNQVGFEKGGYGRYVVIVHHLDGQTLFSLYAHMKATHLVAGDGVDAGDKVGEVGLTGHTTGPHLHFEIHDTTRAINPLKFFSGNTLAMVTK